MLGPVLPALSSAPPCAETILAPFCRQDNEGQDTSKWQSSSSNPGPKFIPTPGEGEEPGLRVARSAPAWFEQHCFLSVDLSWTRSRAPK